MFLKEVIKKMYFQFSLSISLIDEDIACERNYRSSSILFYSKNPFKFLKFISPIISIKWSVRYEKMFS